MNRNITVLTAGFMLIFFGYVSTQQFLTVFYNQQGSAKGGFIVLLLIYAFSIAATFAMPRITKKYSLRKTMMWSSLVYALFIFSLQLNSLPIVFFMAACLGIAAAFLWNTQQIFLVKAATEYGKSSGVFFTGHTISISIGLIMMSYFIPKFDFKMTLLALGFFPILGAIMLSFLPERKGKPIEKHGLKSLLKNKSALRVSFQWIPFFFIKGMAFGLIPLMISKQMGIGWVGFLSSLFYLIPIFFAYYSGKVADKRGWKTNLAVSYFTAICGLILISIPGTLFLVIGIVVLALNSAVMEPLRLTMLGYVSSAKNVDALSAMFFLAGNFGIAFTLLLSSFLDTNYVLISGGILLLIGLMVSYRLIHVSESSIKESLTF